MNVTFISTLKTRDIWMTKKNLPQQSKKNVYFACCSVPAVESVRTETCILSKKTLKKAWLVSPTEREEIIEEQRQKSSVADPHPDRIWIHRGPWIRIRIRNTGSRSRRAKITNIINFILLSVICSLLRAEGFSCSLGVLYGCLGIRKLQFLIKKIIFFSFWSTKPWIRIRITNLIHLKCWSGSWFKKSGSTTLQKCS